MILFFGFTSVILVFVALIQRTSQIIGQDVHLAIFESGKLWYLDATVIHEKFVLDFVWLTGAYAAVICTALLLLMQTQRLALRFYTSPNKISFVINELITCLFVFSVIMWGVFLATKVTDHNYVISIIQGFKHVDIILVNPRTIGAAILQYCLDSVNILVVLLGIKIFIPPTKTKQV